MRSVTCSSTTSIVSTLFLVIIHAIVYVHIPCVALAHQQVPLAQWIQRGDDIDGVVAGDWSSGRSVSLSGNGSVVAIGLTGNDGNGEDSGHVRVYEWDETINGWTQRGNDIDGEAAGDWSGTSVSLSRDGNVVAIGAPKNNGNGWNSGHVRVYEWDMTGNGSWTQRGGDIDGEAKGDESGSSVSLSDDGNVVAIGAPWNDGGNRWNSGHVRVYEWNVTGNGGWTQRGDDIDGETAYDNSGSSVSLSGDGNVVAIGAPENEGVNGIYSGHVRVYEWDMVGNGWAQRGDDVDGEVRHDMSGWSVSLNRDGNVVAIGAYANCEIGYYSGHVRVYQWDVAGNRWTQRGDDIDGEAEEDGSGWSVSLSADGNVVAIGAFANDGENGRDSGHVRVYEWNVTGNGGWTQRGDDIDGEAAGDRSGRSVSLSGDGNVVAIGAPGKHVRVYSVLPTRLIGKSHKSPKGKKGHKSLKGKKGHKSPKGKKVPKTEKGERKQSNK